MAFNSKYTGERVEEILDSVGGKQDKLTAGANITIEDNVISATGGGGGLWNTYCFVGGADGGGASVDGVEIDIPADGVVQGTFTTDIDDVWGSVRAIVIRGDVSLWGVGDCTGVEVIDLTFSPTFARTFDGFAEDCSSLRVLRITGGVMTGGCDYAFKGIGSSDTPCDVSLRMSFADIDVSGQSLFGGATIGTLDLSGATFTAGDGIESLFGGATIGTLDLGGVHLRNGGEEDSEWYWEMLWEGLNQAQGLENIVGAFTNCSESMNVSMLSLGRSSLLTLINAASADHPTEIYISSDTARYLTDSDVDYLSQIGCSISY